MNDRLRMFIGNGFCTKFELALNWPANFRNNFVKSRIKFHFDKVFAAVINQFQHGQYLLLSHPEKFLPAVSTCRKY